MTTPFYRNVLATLFIVFTSLSTFSQTTFKAGYFISNEGSKTECLIKNNDFKNNPTELTYKLNEDSETVKATITAVSKFEIYDSAIFIRANVDVINNSSSANKLDYNSDLDLITSQVFLKILVEGELNLYSYRDANSNLFYYRLNTEVIKTLKYKDIDTDATKSLEYKNVNSPNIKLLQYKKYLNSTNKILKNQDYKRELFNILKCDDITAETIRNLDYTESKLIDFVVLYNNCKNNLDYIYTKKKRTNIFNISLRPGVNFAKASISSGILFNNVGDLEIGNQTSFRIGLEFEYLLPFNNDKWSLVVEPTYQSYSAQKTYNSTPNSALERITTTAIDYSSIELPIGIRFHSFLSKKSHLFTTITTNFDFPFNSEITFNETLETSNNFKIKSGVNFGIGFGYNYNNTYSIEAKLYTKRNILNNSNAISKYSNMSLIFGYTIF